MFQFLLGRLETLDEWVEFVDLDPFQFLLGRLETGDRAMDRVLEMWFQFLLGRLETSIANIAKALVSFVSIPLR